jgi:hypothetical protein
VNVRVMCLTWRKVIDTGGNICVNVRAVCITWSKVIDKGGNICVNVLGYVYNVELDNRYRRKHPCEC